jgi:hypothetical protein
LVPEFACLSDTLHLIDVPRENNGQILRVLMNAELDQAVAFLSPPQKEAEQMETDFIAAGRAGEEHWRWHHRIAQRIAAELDPQQFGVEAFYLIGSTKNATAGPSSDIDLMLHFSGTEEQRRELSSPGRR